MYRFNSWYRGFCQRIIANSWLFVALWLLQFVISIQLFLMWFDLKVWMVARNLIGVTFWAVFFLIFVSLLPQRIGKTVSWIILGLVILIVSFEQYIISSYQTCFTTTIAMVILGTNPHEAFGVPRYDQLSSLGYSLCSSFHYCHSILGMETANS